MQEPTIPAPSYIQHVLDVFEGYGDAEAVVGVDGRRYSYAELRQRSLDTAAALYNHGLRPGMTIGLLVSNPPESYFVQFGAHLLGVRTMYLVRILAPVFLRDVLPAVGADAFVYETATSAEIGRELAEATGLPTYCLGPGGVGPDLNEAPAVAVLPFDPDGITQPRVTMFQTSGTTGRPKVVQHGERFFRAVPQVADFYLPPDRPMRHLLPIGTWHGAGQAAALLTWMVGGTVVMQFGWSIDEVLDKIVRERLTSINIPPSVLIDILEHPKVDQIDFSSLYRVTIAGSSASPAHLEQAAKYFGDALNVVYGMGEFPVISVLPDVATVAAREPHLLTSCGKPWGDVRLEIRDSAGTPLPAGEVGEICVTGGMVTEGYFPPNDVDKRLIDGWLRTGDVGRLDADGYLYIVDRMNDVIVTGLVGENIFPRPIEDALTRHPQVRAAAVVGVPHQYLGEAVHAYVIPAEGATVTGEDLRQHVSGVINEAWTPTEIEFIDEFPLTETGKVDKKKLRERYAARDEQAAGAGAGT